MENEGNHLGQPVGFAVNDWQPPPRPAREMMQGRHCRLEPLNPDRHTVDLFAAYSVDTEGRNWTYLPYGPFASLADFRTWLNTSCLGEDPLFFTILDHAGKTPLGLAAYMRVNPAAGSIEVGSLIYSPALQRSTAATEAMYLMMKHAFEAGYRRYEWKCNALNAASRAAAQRLGFSYEGIFRQAAVIKGRNRDTAWYAAIDTEWPALKAAFNAWLAASNFDESGTQRVRLSALTRPILKQVG